MATNLARACTGVQSPKQKAQCINRKDECHSKNAKRSREHPLRGQSVGLLHGARTSVLHRVEGFTSVAAHGVICTMDGCGVFTRTQTDPSLK
jgi:hypothetical protein